MVTETELQDRAAIKATTERILALRNAMLITRQGQLLKCDSLMTEYERREALLNLALEKSDRNVEDLQELYRKQQRKLDRRRFWGRTGWLVAITAAVVAVLK